MSYHRLYLFGTYVFCYMIVVYMRDHISSTQNIDLTPDEWIGMDIL
jgi:hypothetical protein